MRAFGRVAVILITVLLVACTKTARVGDLIEMGPFTFTVDRAYENRWATDDHCGAIVVALTLASSSHAKVHFDDFLNDSTTPKMMLHPAAELIDRDGHRYIGWTTRVAGREAWQTTFPLSYEETLVSDPTCAASQNPADFRLAITNPDVRRGQPRQVLVALQ